MTFFDNTGKYARFAKCGLFVLSGLVLTACAPLNVGNESASLDAAPVHDAFAAEVASLPQGARVSMPSPLGGDSMVAAGEAYTSALGQQCRPVSVTVSGSVHRLSVCQGENGWYTADPIFEAMPR